MYNRIRVAEVVLASSFCYPLKTVSNLHLVKNGGHGNRDQGTVDGFTSLSGCWWQQLHLSKGSIIGRIDEM